MINQFIQQSLEFFQVYGPLGLFLMSFAESSFFPVPPDVLLIAMSLGAPQMALWYALICSVASVLGGIGGYFIGTKAGRPLLTRWVSVQRIAKIEGLFQRYGGWAVAIAGFTPIPYKVFTIGAGVFRINFTVFIVASLISRSARFFLEGLLIYFLGSTAKYILTNYLDLITFGFAGLVLLVYLLLRHTRFAQGLQAWLKRFQ